MQQPKPRVGFIGTGVMGAPMAGHLLRAGYPLTVFNRTRAKAEPLVRLGARFAGPADIAAECDVIITMVGFPEDVEQLYFGRDGLIERAAPGSFLIDATTSSPELAVRIHEAAKRRGVRAMDAPVSGGDVGARNATLSIMVGADPDDFDAVLPILRVMGATVERQGGPGAGQHAKMSNQIAIASGLLVSARRSPTRRKPASIRRSCWPASVRARPAAGPSRTSGRASSAVISRPASTSSISSRTCASPSHPRSGSAF